MTQMMNEPADTLWTAQDVAAYLKVSRSWVYQRVAEGNLPCFKVAGVVRFDPTAIKAFVRGQGPNTGRVVALKVRQG